MFVFIHPLTCILAEKLSSKSRFFEIEFDNQKAKEFKTSYFFSNVG